MAPQLLRNAVLLDPEAGGPEPGALLLAGGRIAARLRPGEAAPTDVEVIDLGGQGLAPGFIDLHYHGALIFPELRDLEAASHDAAAALLRHGTTAYLATTVAWPREQLGERVTQLASIMTRRAAPGPGAAAIGIHLEGPWINPEAAGAQPREGIREYDAGEAEEVLDRGEGLVRMVTLAPEMSGAPALQAALARRGIVIALGHSLASAAESLRAIELGARHVTHLFNAARVMHHREPGLAGVALDDDRLSFDLICDGIHVHPAILRLVVRARREALVLITDRVDPPDLQRGEADFGSGVLREHGAALRLADGRLAGSRLRQDLALRNACELAGMTRLEAVAACTLRPARVLGIEAERGTLRPGARADFAVLDDAGFVMETWTEGRCAWRGRC